MDEENKSCEVEMYEWSCCNCGVVAMMPKKQNENLRESHKTFWCINGHGNYYPTKTNIEEIEGKLMNEYAKNAQLEGEIKKLKTSFINRILPVKK